ncbi:hypothetical protein POTOM_020506 [Populus tomentosa]|uniref:RING-type E3 ubiquitin transferase n=1 Tax=Populus tomentosa TaxID=118781 RepID=A0A8X8A2E9_POPTO|nr:hypothetical protein POTOM_020506 [Populus tomentosa]
MGPPLQPSTQVRHHNSGLVQPPRYVEHNQAKTIKNVVNVNKSSIKVFADENNLDSHLVSFTFDADVDGRSKSILVLVMAAKQSRVPRFNQNQPKQEVLTMLEIRVEAINETLEGGHNPLDILEEFESKLVLNGYGNCLKNIGASKSCHVGLLRGALDQLFLHTRDNFSFLFNDSITIFYFAKKGDNCTFVPVYPEIYTPRKIPFEKGAGQIFSQPSGTGIDLGFFELDQLSKPSPEEDIFPLVIFAEASSPSLSTSTGQELDKPLPTMSTHAQITEAVLVKNNEGHFQVKVAKQILWIDGIRYELRDIFGIANSDGAGVDGETDSGKECIICMTEPKDTAVLPCRHMCLCSGCAKELRSRSDRCPICRQPIHELLEIKVNNCTSS